MSTWNGPGCCSKDLDLDIVSMRMRDAGIARYEGRVPEIAFSREAAENLCHFPSRSAWTAAAADSRERTRLRDSRRCLSSAMVGGSAKA
jgi:hypothetical protein